MDLRLQNSTQVQHRRGKSLHLYSEASDVFVVPGSTESCFYSTNPGVVRKRMRKHHSTSSRDGALMQETGQQIRANVHTYADRGTLYIIWHMYWWRILLELRLLLLSTAYSVSGSPGLVLGADALLKPSFKIPGPRSRSQGQLFASGDPTGIPLGLAHLGSTCRLLAPADYGKTGPRTSVKFLSTTQPELGTHSLAPGADSLLGPLINILEPLAYLLGLLAYLLGLLAYLLGLLAYLLGLLANIPEPSPRQPHRLFARMLRQVHSHQAFTINV